MTSEVIPMAKTKDLRQTAIRLTPELLRLAKYYLDEENSNLQKFLSEQLERYVERRTQEKQHDRDAVSA
jgi:hypothetical protein